MSYEELAGWKRKMSMAVPIRSFLSGPVGITLTATVVLVPLATWLYSLGDPLAYLKNTLPPGQGLYVLSKLLGLYALLVITVQLLLGMHMAGQPAKAERHRSSVHATLGLICLAFVVGHAGTFIGGVTVRTHHLAIDYLVPTFSHGFYRTIVSLGAVALVLLIIAVLSRSFRHR